MFQRLSIHFLSLVSTFVLALAVIPLKKTEVPALEYINGIINERGPVTYAIIYITVYTLLHIRSAKRNNQVTPTLILGLFGFSLYPIIFGSIGTTLGLASVLSGMASMYMEGGIPTDQLIGGLAAGIGTAFDTVLLGLLATAFILPKIFRLSASNKQTEASQAD